MERQRLADFRRATQAILAAYAVDAAHMKFVAGLDCVIFRIWLRGHRRESVALRFYPEYYGGAEDIAGEIDWLQALARDTQLLVPTPIAARDGSLIQPLQPSLHGMHWCVLLSWVPGRFLYKSLTSGRLQQVGTFTAALHNHAEQYTRVHVLPAHRCAYLPELASWVEKETNRPDWFTTLELDVLADAADKLLQELAGMPRDTHSYGLIHGDLHVDNFLFHGGRAGAIDFSDCGWGHFVYDMASTLVYLKHPLDDAGALIGRYPALREAYLRGYAGVRALPDDWPRTLRSLLAARLFVMLDWMTWHWPSLDVLPWGRAALPIAMSALRQYLRDSDDSEV